MATTQSFMPWKALDSSLECTFDVEGDVLSVYDAIAQRLRLDTLEELPQKAVISLRVEVSRSALASVVPDDPAHATIALVSIRSSSSHIRRCDTLRRGNDPLPDSVCWVANIELLSDDFRGKVELVPMLVRAVDVVGSRDTGYAVKAGSELGIGIPLEVCFDKPEDIPGGSLEVKWAKFAESPLDDLRNARGGLHQLVFDLAVGRPILYLNESVSGARDLLDGSGGGDVGVVRTAVFASVAMQTWTTLTAVAFDAIRQRCIDRDAEAEADWEPRADEVMVALEPWQRDVVRLVAPRISRSADSSECLDDLVARIAAGDLQACLVSAGSAINDICQQASMFKGLNGLGARRGDK